MQRCVENKQSMSCVLLTYSETCYEGITGKVLVATANRTVINHFTSRVNAADARTRVNAFAVLARTILETIGANSALGTTGWWGSDKRGQARADRLTV